MKKKTFPLLFCFIGFVLLYTGINGKTGVTLASLFTPSYVNPLEE